MQRIRVKKDRDFIVLNYKFLKDARISLKAKGLMAYLLALPEDWKIYVTQLTDTLPEGKAAIYAAMRELKKAGYLKIEQQRTKGKITSVDYTLFEISPLTENQEAAKQETENKPLHNIDNNINIKVNKQAEDYPTQLNTDSWLKWCQFREKEYRLKYKQLGEAAAIAKIIKISNEDHEVQEQIIEQSMANGWRGLFPIKKTNKPKIKQTLDNWQAAREQINNG
jgi:hypothetical protein